MTGSPRPASRMLNVTPLTLTVRRCGLTVSAGISSAPRFSQFRLIDFDYWKGLTASITDALHRARTLAYVDYGFNNVHAPRRRNRPSCDRIVPPVVDRAGHFVFRAAGFAAHAVRKLDWMKSAARSAIIKVGIFVFALGNRGMIEASTTRNPRTP